MEAFVEGVIAGLGLALPVGAVALLVMDLGARRGFAPSLAAGAGQVTSYLVHVVIAAVVATVAASFVEDNADLILLLGGLTLIIFGLVGLYRFRTRPEPEVRPEDRDEVSTYFVFVGLTITHVASLIYFGALILGRSGDLLAEADAKTAYIVGAIGAAFVWYLIMVSYSSARNRLLPGGLRVATRFIGNVIVVVLGIRLVLDVF